MTQQTICYCCSTQERLNSSETHHNHLQHETNVYLANQSVDKINSLSEKCLCYWHCDSQTCISQIFTHCIHLTQLVTYIVALKCSWYCIDYCIVLYCIGLELVPGTTVPKDYMISLLPHILIKITQSKRHSKSIYRQNQQPGRKVSLLWALCFPDVYLILTNIYSLQTLVTNCHIYIIAKCSWHCIDYCIVLHRLRTYYCPKRLHHLFVVAVTPQKFLEQKAQQINLQTKSTTPQKSVFALGIGLSNSHKYLLIAYTCHSLSYILLFSVLY